MSSNGKRTLRGIGTGSNSKSSSTNRTVLNINGGGSSCGNGSDTNDMQNDDDKKNSSSNRRRKESLTNSLKSASSSKMAADESKRPRVHAQRKFAQGQGQSPSNSIQGSPAKNSSITAISSAHQSSHRLISDLHRQTMHASTGSRSGNHSSSSSTASGPVSNNSKSNGKSLDSMRKGERPKTEDFLTFLCLRGTNLLPPELDFFNQAPLPISTNENSSEDESLDDATNSYQTGSNSNKQSGPLFDNGRLQSTIGGVRKSASNTSATSRNRALASAVKKTTSPRKDISNAASEKKLPASVQALKKKYTEQRLARSVLQPASRRTRSQTNEATSKEKLKGAKRNLRKIGKEELSKKENSKSSARGENVSERNERDKIIRGQKKADETRRSERVKVVSKTLPTRKPSAAAIIAKRKTRMATLTTAASSRMSRMLSRLTPRGTSSAKFVKSTLRKTLPLERQRSLRGRDISLSSEEEEIDESDSDDDEDEEMPLKSSKSNSNSTPQKTKQKVKCKANSNGKSAKDQESEDEDADEETSSRESSRRPSKQGSSEASIKTNLTMNKRQRKDKLEETNKKKKSNTNSLTKSSALLSDSKRKRDNRSISRDSTGSKDSASSGRPSRKTKEAATVYLNVLGQKLLSNKKEEDTVSIESFSETAQEKRLEELGLDSDKCKKGTKDRKNTKKKESSNKSNDIDENDIDSKSDVDSEASRCDSGKKKTSGKQPKILEGSKDKKKNAKNSLKELQDRLLQEAKKKIALSPGCPGVIGSGSAGIIAGDMIKNDSESTDSDERIVISQKTGYIQVKPRQSIEQQEIFQASHSLDNTHNIPSYVSTNIPTQISQPAVLLGGAGRRLSNDGRTKTPPRKILPKSSESSDDSNITVSNSSTNTPRPHLPVGVMGAALSSSRISKPVVGSNQVKLSLGNNGGTLVSASTMPVVPIIAGSIQGIPTQLSSSTQSTKQNTALTQPLLINTSVQSNSGNGNQVNPVPSSIPIPTQSIIMSNNGVSIPMQVAPSQIPMQVKGGLTSTSSNSIPTGTVTPIQGVPIIMPTGQMALPACNVVQPIISGNSQATSLTSSTIANQVIPISGKLNVSQQKINQLGSVSKNSSPTVVSVAPSTNNVSVSSSASSNSTKKPTVKVKHQQADSIEASKNQSATKDNNSTTSTSSPKLSSSLTTMTKGKTEVTVANKQPLVSPGPPVLSPQMKQKQLQQKQKDKKEARKSPLPTEDNSSDDVIILSPPSTLPQPPPILAPSLFPVTSGAVIRSVAPKQQLARMAQTSSKTNLRPNASITTTSSIRASVPPSSLPANSSSQLKRNPNLEKSNITNRVQGIATASQQNPAVAHMQHLSPNSVFSASSNQHPSQIMPQQMHQQSNYLQPPYPTTSQGVLVQPMQQGSPFSLQHPTATTQQPLQYSYPNYAYHQMPSSSQHQQHINVPIIPQQSHHSSPHITHQNSPGSTNASANNQHRSAIQSPSQCSPQARHPQTMQQHQPKTFSDPNLRKSHSDASFQQNKHNIIRNQESPLNRQQPTQPIKRNEQKQMMDSVLQTIKQEKSKVLFSKSSSSNSNSPQLAKHSPMPTSSSFRVDNESSPYAFEAEPVEMKPQLSYRKPSGSHSTSESILQDKDHAEKVTPHSRKSDPHKSKKDLHPHSKSHHKNSSKFQHSLSKDKLMKGLPTTVEVPDLGSSIPIPDELAAQLAEQAAAEGPKGNQETTYFIPLQSSSGQSFGVAVKLGTEGPPGPDQKVIMKAKLVTQPTGKSAGARVIGSSSNIDSIDQSKESEHVSPTAKKRPKRLSESGPGQKSSKSAATINRKSAYSSSSSSSSEAEATSSESNASSSDSSDNDSDTNRKDRSKKRTKVSPKGKQGRPKGSRNKRDIKEEPDMMMHSPESDKGIHQDFTSCTTCQGKLEAMDRFPKLGQEAHLIEAPVYRPSEKEFKDPIKYIERIRKEAQAFGICKIIPPSSFKPELNVNDDMRFTAYNQYVNRLMNRWGPNSREMAAIKKYLDTQNVTIKSTNHPLVGGVEIDLPALYHAVQDFGGLTEVIQRKKWNKIADFLKVPKGTQDRGNKLDDIYCKFLLPYDTLSPVEREELLRLVDEEWKERKKSKLRRLKREDKLKDGSDDDEDENEDEEDSEIEDEDDDECTLKGKSTSLAAFFRVARNLMSIIFKNHNNPGGANVAGGPGGSSNTANVVVDEEPPHVNEIEEEFWRLVMERDAHVQVQQGSIDTGTGVEGFGFPTSRGSSCGRHPWNLKILSNNIRSLLRCMGAIMGVTVPTLHVGMLFTTGCWYRDPHGLPWIEYNHTGASKVWYGVPDSHSIAFYTAMKLLVPLYCHRKKVWLPADTVMVPPKVLVKHGVSVSRSVQEPGQFIVVFPRSYTSSFCTGYSIAESVYFAPRDYLDFAELEFQNIRDSGEPMLFPLSKLLLSIAKDEKSRKGTLRKVKPYLESIRDYEYIKRTMISDMGVKHSERITLRTKKQEEDDEYECETCSANLYVSFLCDIKEDAYFCPEHALQYLQERKMAQRKNCKLFYTHSKEEISAIIKSVNQRLEDSDDEDSSSEDEMTQPPCKRISEMNKMQWTPKPKDHILPLHGHLEVKNTSTGHRLPPSSSTRIPQRSPSTEPTSPSARLSGPNVPPGTSVNVSSFSLIQHAKGKKLAASQDKSSKDKKSPDSVKKSTKKQTSVDSKSSKKKESPKPTKSQSKNKKNDREKTIKGEKVANKKKDTKKDTKSSKDKSNTSKKRKLEDQQSDDQSSGSESGEDSSSEEANSSDDESSSSPPLAKKTKKQPVKPQKSKKSPPSMKKKKENPAPQEKRRASRRPVKKRKAAQNKSGNLTSELLDMLLSESDFSDEEEQGEDSSDESWK